MIAAGRSINERQSTLLSGFPRWYGSRQLDSDVVKSEEKRPYRESQISRRPPNPHQEITATDLKKSLRQISRNHCNRFQEITVPEV